VTAESAAAYTRDDEAVARFIENFATVLTESGLPRMPARVFVGLLATDSGAVRYLTRVGMIGRARDPGTRRDQYLVYDDVWYEAILHRDPLLARWERSALEGIEVLGPGSPAGRRMAETKAFFEFLEGEMPPMLKRWREHRARLRDELPAEPATRR
jgi:hypothetical protein